MFYSWIKKCKNVICLILMFCVVAPLIIACGDLDNGVKSNLSNAKIGYGGNITAYTTYRTAPFNRMSKELYYSYIMNYRPFILVLVPDNAVSLDANGNVIGINNIMLNAAASGVIQYNSQYSNYIDNEFKILMYYVTISEFESWENEALKNEALKEDSLLYNAYNFIEGDKPENLEYNPKYFSCRILVNYGSYLSSDETCLKTNSDGSINNKSIFNVGEGEILLFGEGYLAGYIKKSQIDDFNVNSLNIVREIERKNIALDDKVKEIFKVKFDIAILNRISKLNKYTYLDYSNNDNVFNNKYLLQSYDIKDVSQNEMLQAVSGKEDFENKSYIAFVTADGFIFDRGNTLANGALATLDESYAMLLQELMRMDSCPNETLVNVILSQLSKGAILAGGAILVASLFVTPFPGARIIGLALLVAGLIYNAVNSGAAASSENYCEIYQSVLEELKNTSSFAVPIVHYNIGKDPDGKAVTFKLSEDSDKGIDMYYYANIDVANNLKVTGMPYLGFYHKGKLVDSINGASNITFISEILTSWGVRVTSDSKYFSKYENGSITVVDRGRTDSVKTNISYCYSFEYGLGIDSNCIGNTVRSFSNLSVNNYTYSHADNVTADSFTTDIENYLKTKLINYTDLVLNMSDYIGRLNQSANEDGFISVLDDFYNKLTNISGSNYANSDMTQIVTKIEEAKTNIVNGISYFSDANGNKYIVSNNLVNLKGVMYIFDPIQKQLKLYSDQNNVIGEIEGKFTIESDSYTYHLSAPSFEEKRNIIVTAFESELKGLTYYAIEVPIYINLQVTESIPALSDGERINDENNRACAYSDIRVNKIWGNKKCVTDLQWYHIKENWVKPSQTNVKTNSSTKYQDVVYGFKL